MIRGDESLAEKIEYVRQNPVRKGLVLRAEDYRWAVAQPPSGCSPAAPGCGFE